MTLLREVFELSAILRLSKDISKEEKKKMVDGIIASLALERCQNNLVGGVHIRGVSGGERKRVCIGNELITNPPLFFLDGCSSIFISLFKYATTPPSSSLYKYCYLLTQYNTPPFLHFSPFFSLKLLHYIYCCMYR